MPARWDVRRYRLLIVLIVAGTVAAPLGLAGVAAASDDGESCQIDNPVALDENG